MGEERIWAKRGSRIQLPHVPLPSRATLLRAIPSVGVVSLSLVGLLAVPAGSPPPPPAVAAAPTASGPPVTTVEPTVPILSLESPLVCAPVVHAPKKMFPRSQSGRATAIVYEDDASIVLYDEASGVRTMLIGSADYCAFSQPRFLDERTVAFMVSYGGDNFVGAIDMLTASVRPVQTNLTALDAQSLAITPEGHSIAVLDGAQNDALLAAHVRGWLTLRASSTISGGTTFTRTFRTDCPCRSGTLPSLEWSRDGLLLLVTVVDKRGRASSYAFDRSGKTAWPAVDGDSARWIGSSHRFIYRTQSRYGNSWRLVDVGGKTAEFLLNSRADLAEPSLSPDGSKIAFDDESGVRVLVYDIRGHLLHSYSHRLFPLWMSPDTLAVSAVRLIGCGGCNPYLPTGAVYQISISTQAVQPARFTQTADADVWF